MLISIVYGALIIFINIIDGVIVAVWIHDCRTLITMPSTDIVSQLMGCDGFIEGGTFSIKVGFIQP